MCGRRRFWCCRPTFLSSLRGHGPITEEERTSITDENRRLIEESASIIATGVKRGWISFPAKTEAETWVPSPTGPQPPDPLSMIWPES
jgi:hypothetical protein